MWSCKIYIFIVCLLQHCEPCKQEFVISRVCLWRLSFTHFFLWQSQWLPWAHSTNCDFQAAREKTEKIISAELRKAASNPELQGHLASVTQSAFACMQNTDTNSDKTNGQDFIHEEDSVDMPEPMEEKIDSGLSDSESLADNIGAEVDIPVMPSLGMSSEHAYSSASKLPASESHLFCACYGVLLQNRSMYLWQMVTLPTSFVFKMIMVKLWCDLVSLLCETWTDFCWSFARKPSLAVFAVTVCSNRAWYHFAWPGLGKLLISSMNICLDLLVFECWKLLIFCTGH